MTPSIAAPESTICAEGDLSNPPDLRILHFNDVYHVEASSHDPVGGITRFQTMCNHYRYAAKYDGQPELMAFFSGDGFNPSLESSVTKGAHMVPILNAVPTAAACVSNHDLDLGVPQYEHLTSQCKFPWLLANVTDPALGDDVPLGHAQKTTILTASNGVKVGLIGLAEKEWLDAVSALPPNLVYTNPAVAAKKLVPGLREHGADMVVALCHQREVNDNKLATETSTGLIDIILGGHDHHYRYSKIKQTHVLCSGSDFKQLSYIEARRQRRDGTCSWEFNVTRREIVAAIPEDSSTFALMDHMFSSLQAKLKKTIGYTAVPLDARFTTVRTRESNLGNFVCDLMRYYYDADCGIMSSGTIRGDTIYLPGVLKMKDIMDCFPFEDPTIVVKISGKALLQALENGVCHYPALDGRFPQVSSINFAFDPAAATGQRITRVEIGGSALDFQKEYTVATRDYMATGGDGYASLLLTTHGGAAVPIVKEENGILMSMLLRQYFMSRMAVGKWRDWGAPLRSHWGAVQSELKRGGSTLEASGSQHMLGRSSSKDAVTDAERAHAPGLVGKALRCERYGSGVDHGNKPRILVKAPTGPAGSAGESTFLELSDTEDEIEITPPISKSSQRTQQEKDVQLVRRAARKWWRLVEQRKEKRHSEDLEEGEELDCCWTKGICPRTEGRIKIVTSQASKLSS